MRTEDLLAVADKLRLIARDMQQLSSRTDAADDGECRALVAVRDVADEIVMLATERFDRSQPRATLADVQAKIDDPVRAAVFTDPGGVYELIIHSRTTGRQISIGIRDGEVFSISEDDKPNMHPLSDETLGWLRWVLGVEGGVK